MCLQKTLSIRADLFEEDISKSDVSNALMAYLSQYLGHALLIIGIGTRIRERCLDTGQTQSLGLHVEQLQAHTVYGRTRLDFVVRRPQPHELPSRIFHQTAQAQSAVLSRTPRQNDFSPPHTSTCQMLKYRTFMLKNLAFR